MTAPQNPPPASSGSSGLEPNVASLLCYICSPISAIIFLVIEKNNRDVKFHAWQSIFLAVAVIAISIVLTILSFIMFRISYGLGGVFQFVVWIFDLGVLALVIVAMIKAYQKERWHIPFIGNLAEQQANK